MDLKIRFKDNQNNKGFPTSPQDATNQDNRFSQYMRPKKNASNSNNTLKQQRMSQSQNKSSVNQYLKNKNNINGYRADINAHAPENQFRRYLLDAKNVFYEDRRELVLSQRYNGFKWMSGILFLILLVGYISINFIRPFTLQCPSNATCGVFVHCFNGYEYKKDENRCQISSDLLDQTSQTLMSIISRLKTQFGQQDCSGQSEGKMAPCSTLDQLLIGIQDQTLKRQVTQRMQNFLNDKQQQQQKGFQYHSYNQMIVPTTKEYTLSCRLTIIFQSRNSKIKLAITLVIFCFLVLFINWIRRYFKARFLYKILRKKTLAEKMINISYVKEDLEQKYGSIDEQLWKAIDSIRHSDRDIVFLQDDFLYWKAL